MDITLKTSLLKRIIYIMGFLTSVTAFLIFYLHILLLPVSGSTFVYDDFDDGILDPAWSVTFQDATGWEYTESGTNITVTDINPTIINPGAGGTWAKVILSQTFIPLTDFCVHIDFSWNSENSDKAVQRFCLRLYDTDGAEISCAFYRDSWVEGRGEKDVSVGTNRYESGGNTLPYNGSASIDVSRADDDVSVSWNGTELVSGKSHRSLNRVDVEFWYNAYTGPGGPSFFGSESVDLINPSLPRFSLKSQKMEETIV